MRSLIGFGLDTRPNSAGIIRNNMIYHANNGAPYADVPIALTESPNTQVYYYFFHGRFTPPADRIGAFAGGFFLLLSIGAFQNAWRARKNRGRLDNALTGASFEDGRQVAAVGPIAALGAPIESPFTHQPCVICSWDISHVSTTRSSSGGSETQDVKDFTGLHMTPCAVNAPGGTARILGFATLEGFDESAEAPEAFANAESYLKSTPFERVGLLQIFSQVKELITDDDGYIRKDLRIYQQLRMS